MNALQSIAAELHAPESASGRAALRRITLQIDLGDERLRARIKLSAAKTADSEDSLANIAPLSLDQPITIIRRGKELRLVLRGASGNQSVPDAPLIRMLI